MKFNWGTGIMIFYTCFVVVMVSIVVASFYHKSHLVKEDYYQLDLDYEEHRQKRENANRLVEPLEVKYNQHTNSLDLTFPPSMSNISGNVYLFRPSDKFLDRQFRLLIDSTKKMSIQFDQQLMTGLWNVKLDWESGGMSYYKKIDLVL